MCFCTPKKSLYNDLDGIKKFFLFNAISTTSNKFIFSTINVEPKIKINNEYINAWNFRHNYVLKNTSNIQDILSSYISKNQIQLFTTYKIHSIKELLLISFIEILKNNITIQKCRNCGNYFITLSRTDEKYCNRISPQNANKTCKEYGAKKIYREAIKSRPVNIENTRTRQFYRMRIKRSKTQKEKKKYEKLFNKYKENFEKNNAEYESGNLKEKDFIEWIKEQKKLPPQ